MCGIAGVLDLSNEPIMELTAQLDRMNDLQRHRGPDGEGIWAHSRQHVGLAHRRLSIIDLAAGRQPMSDESGNQVTFNGEIYNYVELRQELGEEQFRTRSDTEVILRAYQRWGTDCVQHFRGMFAFALWDEARQTLFCGRDHFGIKPFYYVVVDGRLYIASEVKGLLPFLDSVETDPLGLKDYLAFQFCLAGKTLFKGVRELAPGHTLTVCHGHLRQERYWQVYYDLDFDHTERYFEERLRALLADSIRLHLRSDVPVGAYLSGGLDSSIIAALASKQSAPPMQAFCGRFAAGPAYDESPFARDVARMCGLTLHEIEITASDVIDNLRRVIHHLDFPVAGPGALPQYIVSRQAARTQKVILGGQGGDEIFGGYTRYLIAYFEQCIKAAIDGTMGNGKFIVSYESIIPNLQGLRLYKPMLQEFWREGLFDAIDRRYFRLINRAPDLGNVVRWDRLGDYSPYETFRGIFHGDNVQKESYFDLMTHFDFKTLLPALLHVEDRVSMAHGLESRVPFLDHPLIEFAATIPSSIKFTNGTMKNVLRNAFRAAIPPSVTARTDKMGFPVPFGEWMQGPAFEFVHDILATGAARNRDYIDNQPFLDEFEKTRAFTRKTWGLLCLELWQQEFHDAAGTCRRLLPHPQARRKCA